MFIIQCGSFRILILMDLPLQHSQHIHTTSGWVKLKMGELQFFKGATIVIPCGREMAEFVNRGCVRLANSVGKFRILRWLRFP